jgi:hypothetical protein
MVRLAAATTLSQVRRVRFVAVVLVVALAAGCGSEKPKTTTDWANGVCTAITTWRDSTKSAADSVASGGISKDSLQSAADDAKSATETLESDLKDLGKPNTPAGQQAKDSVDQLTSELKTDADTIKAAVDAVSGVRGVVTAATTVSTTLITAGNQISTTFKGLHQLSADAKRELQTAFQQSSACQQLSGTGSGPSPTTT